MKQKNKTSSKYDFFIDTTLGFFIDKCYIWKRSLESRKRTSGGFLPLLPLLLVIKPMSGKGVTRGGRGYNNMDHMDKKILVLLHTLSNIEITKYFN